MARDERGVLRGVARVGLKQHEHQINVAPARLEDALARSDHHHLRYRNTLRWVEYTPALTVLPADDMAVLRDFHHCEHLGLETIGERSRVANRQDRAACSPSGLAPAMTELDRPSAACRRSSHARLLSYAVA
jgi:hypothetical protein